MEDKDETLSLERILFSPSGYVVIPKGISTKKNKKSMIKV
jgi:hypothetical protein